MKKLPLSQAVKLLVWGMISFFIACKGPQGDVGPQGSPGPQGTPGSQGIQGVQGPAGSANLIVSPWTKVAAPSWVANQDSTYFVFSKDDATVTQPILEKGLVMAYYRNAGRESVVFSLPAANEELVLGFFMRMLNGKGSVNFDLTYYKPHPEPIDFDLEFRWIIIPPAPGGRQTNLNWNDYQLVKRELGLLD
jgi:hypothetical protein